jgi:hypothetical protein
VVDLVQNNKIQLLITTQEKTISHGNSRFPKKISYCHYSRFSIAKKRKKRIPLLCRGISYSRSFIPLFNGENDVQKFPLTLGQHFRLNNGLSQDRQVKRFLQADRFPQQEDGGSGVPPFVLQPPAPKYQESQ